MKRTVIAISSSSSSAEEEEEEEEMSSQESEDSDSSYGDSVKEFSSTTCHKEDSEDDDGEECEGKDEESSSCRRVVQLLKENCDIQVLTVMESKAYLRRHGLRLSGTRAECIQRIKEHWRLKDGNGEVLYPRSTFSINCTGDVCKGDVVLFNQKVYKKFDKASRRGRFSGKRWVAGRVIKESYGAAKQQHTFTVEVLWSNGVDKLPVLYPLLIKGRNLYRMKTFRQRWKDENQRAKVLAEKHERGDAARSVRDTRWAKSAKKRKRNASTNNKGQKRQKKDHQHTQTFQNVRPFVEVAKKVEEHAKPAKQKEIVCKQKVTTKKTSQLSAYISQPKQVEEHTKPAKQKEIYKQKVMPNKTTELSGSISHHSKHTDQHSRPSQNVGQSLKCAKLVEEHTKPAQQKEICMPKVTMKKTSELSGPISYPNHTDQNTHSSQTVKQLVEIAKHVEEHSNPAKQKEICTPNITTKKTSELMGHTYSSHPFEVGPSLSQPLHFPRHPTHFPLQQNHHNPVPPNFFSSSVPFSNGGFPGLHPHPVFSPYRPFSNGGFPGLHPRPVLVDPPIINFDNHLYPPHPFQETGWRNPSIYTGRGDYFERRRYHPYY